MESEKIYKKILISLLMLALINFSVGCLSSKSIAIPEYEKVGKEEGKPDEIYVNTKDSNKYHFVDTGYFIVNDTLYGKGTMVEESIFGDNERPFEGKLALADIESIEVEYLDEEKTIINSLLLVSLALVLVMVMDAATGDLSFGTK